MSGEALKDSPVQLDIFYNTNHMDRKELRRHQIAAAGQCRKILGFFRDNPAGNFTPFDVQTLSDMERTPITSIRRAMHTLTRAGYLVKTEHMREGEYGVNNHTWKLA